MSDLSDLFFLHYKGLPFSPHTQIIIYFMKLFLIKLAGLLLHLLFSYHIYFNLITEIYSCKASLKELLLGSQEHSDLVSETVSLAG